MQFGRPMSENNHADFWNNLPGPGLWTLNDFELVPPGLELWDGVRFAAARRLGEAWTLEQVDEGTLLLRRKERPLAVRLRRLAHEPDNAYELAAVLLVPDEKALDYTVGIEFFQDAFHERLDWKIHTPSTISPPEGGARGDPVLKDCKLILNLRYNRQPQPEEIRVLSCWLVWAVLALEWAAETIEANPNP